MKPAEQYLTWRKISRKVGCTFASYIAFDPKGYAKQDVKEISQKRPKAIARAIDKCVNAGLLDLSISALTLVVPHLQPIDNLLKTSLELKKLAQWNVNFWHLPDAPGGPAVAVGITRNIRLANGEDVPSEVLVLGPFDCVPNTRRAPVTAIEIFVGIPPEVDLKSGGPLKKANLANISVPVPSERFDFMWSSSISNRLKSLQGVEDCRAKAKVSFSVPLQLAQSLGCQP